MSAAAVVGDAVEIAVESQDRALVTAGSALSIQMMGRLRVMRDGHSIDLPASRKMRALLAYLALSDHPVGRSRLCEMMGDLPSDPRGELRWYLSKLRSVLGHRVIATGDMVSLDLETAEVDAIEIYRAVRKGLDTLETDLLRDLLSLFVGDFLEGLDLNRSPQLDHWLTTLRRHFRSCHAAVLAQLSERLPADDPERRRLCEVWVTVAPFDLRAQAALLAALPQAEAERHLAAAVRLFEAEGMDPAPLRLAWRGLRTAPATVEAVGRASGSAIEATPEADRKRAALAVMPFRELDTDPARADLGAGLTRDIITRLAKLRAVFVIAQGSVFALAERGLGPQDAAERLQVDYVASGLVSRRDGHFMISVELVDARTQRIVWSDEYEAAEGDAFEILDRIGDTIVWAIASEVETAEKNRAILKPPNSLNAWEAYHRGLWHMYRFTKADNRQAQDYFSRSIATDPTFARAHSGLSFTHWQNAFQEWEDRSIETDLAYDAARRSLLADDHDPSAHWAMGRALWLRRDQRQAIAELEQAVELSPNFALGHYALSFVHSQSGDPQTAIASAETSQRLSPFDPLLFGMFGARAMAYVRLGNFAEATDWALKAVARPNAHVLIQQIAALCLALSGRIKEARTLAATIRSSVPNCRIEDFLRAFKFPSETEAVFRSAAAMIDLN
jgi:TolB-like protein